MSKEKLTIENLAPYLPYRLRIGRFNYDGNFKRIEYLLTGANIPEVVRYSNLKPILRPLSDLKHDYVFRELYFLIGGGYKSYETFKKSQLDNYLYTPPEMWSYRVLKLFLSLHVDLFGLIEKGLALNLNDLKDE